jgi:hypothetical protein
VSTTGEHPPIGGAVWTCFDDNTDFTAEKYNDRNRLLAGAALRVEPSPAPLMYGSSLRASRSSENLAIHRE